MKKSVLILLSLTLLIAACSGGGGSSESDAQVNVSDDTQSVAEQQPETQPESTPSMPEGTPVPALPLSEAGEQLVARVNGEPITLSEFEIAFDRQSIPNDAASYDALAAALLETIIEQRLINQAAAQMGVTVTDEEVNAELERNRAEMGSDEQWQIWLDENNYTEDDLRASLRDWLITQRVQGAVVQVEMGEVTEVRARHIVVETEAEAVNVMARLDAGEDFDTLAATLSRDVTTRDSGGDLGWFGAETLLVPELTAEVFQMQIGEVRGPVQTMLGYHVVQLMDVQTREAVDTDTVTVAVDQFTAWLEEQRSAATIERYIN